MAKRTFHFKKLSIVKSDMTIDVDLSRFEGQFQKAQFVLDTDVMNSMLPLMPMNNNVFKDLTQAESRSLAGSGIVVAAAPPFGRFLYEGKVMADEVTGSPWARKGAKKIVTDRPLDYSNPDAVAHWFDAAKEKDGAAWVRDVKKIAGGGSK